MTAPLSHKAIPIPRELGSYASEFWRAHDDKLRQCAAEGMTAKQAAEVLGVTRNAVIGRGQRAGVVWKRPGVGGYAARNKPRSKPMREWEFPEPGRCVYPHGHPREPGFSFCGEAVKNPGAPYCVDHDKLCRPSALSEQRRREWEGADERRLQLAARISVLGGNKARRERREQDIGRQWEAAE